MTESFSELSTRYAGALRSYLATGGEEALHAAYELGRFAVGQGLGLVVYVRNLALGRVPQAA